MSFGCSLEGDGFNIEATVCSHLLETKSFDDFGTESFGRETVGTGDALPFFGSFYL